MPILLQLMLIPNISFVKSEPDTSLQLKFHLVPSVGQTSVSGLQWTADVATTRDTTVAPPECTPPHTPLWS
jgi:hypothetical protein